MRHCCFHVLAIVNSATVNIRVHVSFLMKVLSRYVPRRGIGGSYGSSILSYMRNLHIVFHSGCTNLNSHQQWRRIHFFHILSSICYLLLLMAILTSERSCLIVVLICVSLLISDIEHFLMCILAIHMYSLEKGPFKSSVHFSIGLFFFCCCCWVVWVLCTFWRLSPCLLHCSQRFSSILWVVFFFLSGFLCYLKAFELIRSHWFIFLFIVMILGGGWNKMLLWFMSSSAVPVFL